MRLLLILLLSMQTFLMAQGLVMRNHGAHPFLVESPEGLLSATHYSAEASRGFGSTGQEHYWNIKFNALIEFYNWGSVKLGLIGSNELTANPYSDISFNPRSSNWNERIIVYVDHGAITSEWGITHQCKHDIDNHGTAQRGDGTGFVGGNRVIVLTSVHGGASTRNTFLSGRITVDSDVRFNHYILAVDEIVGDTIQSLDWSTIRQSLHLGVRAGYAIGGDNLIYLNSWVNPIRMGGGSDMQVPYHVESGLSLAGHSAYLDIYYAYEHYFDDVINPWSQSSDVYSLGLRIRSSVF
ncbi:MAG: hypothetical protein OCC49_14655 [Fibrobacterales bacterium]